MTAVDLTVAANRARKRRDQMAKAAERQPAYRRRARSRKVAKALLAGLEQLHALQLLAYVQRLDAERSRSLTPVATGCSAATGSPTSSPPAWRT
jgi:hypothetical protein